ncbi:MAG: DNA polymerase III subunit gamma/tau [Oscillospiraceae bacterium]|nr:DNA polymerase III subunit gamma/tau [Oscillospiraceae bacterium]
MAAYEALYRKWRPQTFDDIVAQPHITTTLKNQIMRNKTAHAYLFTGSRGTGKTTSARIFSKAVNCLHPQNGNPCLECEICKDAEAGALTDIIEIDGASNNGVEEVRALRENAAFMPVRCKYKVYIIDEVHMLSAGAFNALLKIIEEPPAYVKFAFATTEIHKVPATILSRCQRFDFRRILPQDIAGRIQYIAAHESFTVSDAAAHRIAVLADGGMRDALSLLDQCAAVSDEIESETVENAVGAVGTAAIFRILHAIADHQAADALECIGTLYQQSKDMTRFADEISQHLRSLMLLKTAPKDASLDSMMPDERSALEEISGKLSLSDILSALNSIHQCCDRMARSGNRRMELELTIIRLCSEMQSQQGDVRALTDRVAQLEQQIAQLMKNGVPAPAVHIPPAPRKNVESNAKVPAQSLQVEQRPDTTSYQPVKNWAAVLEAFFDKNPSVAGLLQESQAFANDTTGILVMVVRNRLFKRLFTTQDAASLGNACLQILGKKYSIRYKVEEPSEQGNLPVDALLNRAKSEGISVGESESPGV